MPIFPVQVPVYLPNWIYPVARRVGRAVLPKVKRRTPNLLGDRDVEYSFIAGNLPPGPGAALDFGSGPAFLSLIAAQRGYRVTALDMQPTEIFWRHPAVTFVRGDLLKVELPESYFDLVMNCSAVEHVGLAGSYRIVEKRDDGDLEAMDRMRALMKPGGVMLLTIPCGRDAVCAPHFRAYGERRLPLLLQGFDAQEESYWMKDSEDRWVLCEKKRALRYEPYADPFQPLYNSYALGCFALRKPLSGTGARPDRTLTIS